MIFYSYGGFYRVSDIIRNISVWKPETREREREKKRKKKMEKKTKKKRRERDMMFRARFSFDLNTQLKIIRIHVQ